MFLSCLKKSVARINTILMYFVFKDTATDSSNRGTQNRMFKRKTILSDFMLFC